VGKILNQNFIMNFRTSQTFSNDWERTPEEIEILENKIRNELIEYHILPEIQKVKIISNTKNRIPQELHFENGHYLHSSQYYFAKRYFQSSDNCDDLAILFANRLKSINIKNITLIGFKSYLGLLLNKTKALLHPTYKIDYAIIEQLDGDKFTWQQLPDFSKINTKFLIVLPITCTCSTYMRIRKYIEIQLLEYLNLNYPKENHSKWEVLRKFINVFIVLDSALENVTNTIIINEEILKKNFLSENLNLNEIEYKTSKLYSDFNWEKIDCNTIYLGRNDQRNNIGYSLIKLYSDLHLAEECNFCFPNEDLTVEKNIFRTHDNFQTPNLLEHFPSFGIKRDLKHLLPAHKSHVLNHSTLLFTNLFPLDHESSPSHHYGHIDVNGNSYLYYIRGNKFFNQNRNAILYFFNEILTNILINDETNINIKDIVFITAENNHNSTFLEEIVTYKKRDSNGKKIGVLSKNVKGQNSYNVYILRFDAHNEFIDNFIENYKTLIEKNNVLFIYFEEVLSAGKSFKLVSNYIKHFRNRYSKEKNNQHGFDYVFTIINRTSYYTHEEILNKLHSEKNNHSEKNFISFFDLNVPIIAAAHLGNPLKENIEVLFNMVSNSHFDVLKKIISNELPNKIASNLPEENIENNLNKHLRYFPFENTEGEITQELFFLYKDILQNGRLDLLKLYIAHEINTIFTDDISNDGQRVILEKLADKGKLISSITNKIIDKIIDTNEAFFTPLNSISNRLKLIEDEIIHDTIIKILARHPFTFFTKIYDAIFKYCLIEMNKLLKEIQNNSDIPSFIQLRKFKFYIRRLVDLDSSYLISDDFIFLIKHLYEYKLENGKNRIQTCLEQIDSDISEKSKSNYLLKDLSEFEKTILNNLIYKYNSINSFLSFLLCLYKESIYKNPYRTIKLESILNTDKLLPQIEKSNQVNEDTIQLIKDPYYQIMGMIKSENLYIINQLKNLHKDKYKTYISQLDLIQKNKSILEEEKQILLNNLNSKWLDPDLPNDIINYYFETRKNDPIISYVRKFVKKSRLIFEGQDNHRLIKSSISNMLKSVTMLTNNTSFNQGDDFIDGIHNILKVIVSILQPGIENNIDPCSLESKLGYILCVKYSNKSNETIPEENIYIFSSEKSSIGSNLSPDGLIYNLMNGLFNSKEKGVFNLKAKDKNKDKLIGEQSLLKVVRISQNIHSFNNNYFTIKNSCVKSFDFQELYNNDCLYFRDIGLTLLSKANMSLFFRLSKLNTLNLKFGNCDLEGKAVLIITCTELFNKTNYLRFMCNEKVRLLLIIKEELLEYLNKITSNDAFYQFIKNIRLLNYQSKLRHGLEKYFKAQTSIINSNSNSEKNKLLLEAINGAIKGQVNFYNTKNNQLNVYSTKEIKRKLSALLESDLIEGKVVSDKNYNIIFNKINKLNLDTCIYNVVILELLINAKRHSPKIKANINLNFSFDKIVISNNIKIKKKTEENNNENERMGIEMCKTICEKLDYEFDNKQDNEIYIVTIKLPSYEKNINN